MAERRAPYLAKEEQATVATYIQLLVLTPEGRAKVLDDPEFILRTQDAIATGGIQVLGMYGVLGGWDFVNIVDAPDNEAVARFSLELGVRAGCHVTTLPAIPIGRLEGAQPSELRELVTGRSRERPRPDTPEGKGDERQ